MLQSLMIRIHNTQWLRQRMTLIQIPLPQHQLPGPPHSVNPANTTQPPPLTATAQTARVISPLYPWQTTDNFTLTFALTIMKPYSKTTWLPTSKNTQQLFDTSGTEDSKNCDLDTNSNSNQIWTLKKQKYVFLHHAHVYLSSFQCNLIQSVN